MRLTVLFDTNCRFCCNCAHWLKRQESFFPVECLPVQSQKVALRYPELDLSQTAKELTVIDDAGNVYLGDKAYIMCLYALVRYREWALKLSQPAMWPYVKRALHYVTLNRKSFSKFLSIIDANGTGKEPQSRRNKKEDPRRRYASFSGSGV